MTIESKLDQIVECLQKLVDGRTWRDEVVRHSEVVGSSEIDAQSVMAAKFYKAGIEEGRRQTVQRERVMFTAHDMIEVAFECAVHVPYPVAEELIPSFQRWLDAKVNV